ncbi:MAG: hypothetical protein HFI09_01440 [Bacilli bacterium]|nr:hypothetical protein [Bacilli bacterium]
MLLDNRYNNKKSELSKLVSFAYDLYEDKLNYFNSSGDLFPRSYNYDNVSYDSFRIPEGIVWGNRGYSSHSCSSVFTELGLTVGQIVNGKLLFDYAIEFNIDNEDRNLMIYLLDYNREEEDRPELFLSSSDFTDLNEDERINIFVRSMVILGFKEEDVKKVLKGTMTAREAYINIAPDDKKYRQWVNYERSYFEFDRNVAVKGRFSNVFFIDDFPFPFDGEVVIDCNGAVTSCIKLGNNNRKVRLIHVNQNKDSIRFADIRNAIIDEVIDLSKVDATGTRFGHQKVCNIDNSIADIKDMDLTLACDINGNAFKTNEVGKVILNEFGKPLINRFIQEDENRLDLKVLANVDTEAMIEQALNTNRDGIGLIRTETLFYTREKLEKYRLLFLSHDYDIDDDGSLKKLLENFKQEQQSFLETIFSHMKDDFITVRLFDFRLQDVLRYSKKTMAELEREYFLDIPESRGEKYFEYRHSKLLKAQIEAILEACCKTGRKINILVPYIDSPDSLNYIKETIANINVSYHIDYRFGAMIENTSSVSQCDRISKQVDFISFGLNDLTESVTQKSRNTGDNDFFYLMLNI